MQYEKFEEWMVGKRVKCKETGDVGVITRQVHFTNPPWVGVWVLLEQCGQPGNEVWVFLDDLEFDDALSLQQPYNQEITIDGKRYKLVPIEEE